MIPLESNESIKPERYPHALKKKEKETRPHIKVHEAEQEKYPEEGSKREFQFFQSKVWNGVKRGPGFLVR